jgi:hypothetical protein
MAGVTAIETSTAGVIVRVVDPLIVPDVALTVVLPEATLVAAPCALITATLLSSVDQLADAVRSKVPPSV